MEFSFSPQADRKKSDTSGLELQNIFTEYHILLYCTVHMFNTSSSQIICCVFKFMVWSISASSNSGNILLEAKIIY